MFDTANEIHIPVDVPVRLKLLSEDVIHSFWVPAIGGKTDMIPGQTNVTWIEATRVGTYRGVCAEFCGLQHARMAFVLVAKSAEDFAAWWDAQLLPAPEPTTDLIQEGLNTFTLRCGACHAVRGTRAGGKLGPDLSHLMSRKTLAAGTLPNVIEHLSDWIADPQSIKPGNPMPEVDLSARELNAIVAYLGTLK
jgi:cytochrome c oxidase subunit 2